MAVEFRLPDVGEGLEEAEIVRWLVAVGDTVDRDQSVVEIQTDKALVEIPSPSAGRIERLGAAEGDIVKVGQLLFVVENGSSSATPHPEEAAEMKVADRPRKKQRAKASPAVRRLAVELGIDLSRVSGRGPGDRVTAEDVRAAVDGDTREVAASESAAAAQGPLATRLGQAPFGTMPLRGIRRATAKAMSRAWDEIPHIHGADEIDASALLDARRRLRESLGEEEKLLTPLSFFVLAAARALRRFPLVNASLDMEKEEIVVHEEVNIGVAVATSDGLIVPVLRQADRRTLMEVAREMDRLTRASRSRTVEPEELRGGTFTVSNYGSLGGRFATPIVRPPEAAILGFGAIRKRPFVVGEEVVARPTLPICFGADHRLIDGDLSVAFQEHVKLLLSDPIHLLLG